MLHTTTACHVLRVENSVEHRPILHCALERIPIHEIEIFLRYFITARIVVPGRPASGIGINCVRWGSDDPASSNLNGDWVLGEHAVDEPVFPDGSTQRPFCQLVGVAIELLNWGEKFPRNVFVQMTLHILEVGADRKQLNHFPHRENKICMRPIVLEFPLGVIPVSDDTFAVRPKRPN